MTEELPSEEIITRSVEEEMKESYLRYSLSVIVSRALPDVRDGLKPSQRRILYAMRQLNLTPGAKQRKCAKICGDTSGDFHPHGEMVVYPTLVRMAQDWVMRYTLVEGQGNFGSIDGDGPAQMRYTEARLTRAAMQLMEDLDKETVEYIPNYDDTKEEPTVFPASFPNLLCNGGSGIAVGMATNIPPHNLQEVVAATLHLLGSPSASIEELITHLPGPDFPTGGIICGYRGIREAYHTGRGKLIVRGQITIDELPNDRHRLVVHELPYNVNKARLIEHLAELVNAKTLTSIADLRDESDKEGMRITIDLKRGEIPEVTLNQLYKFSELQVTFGCNIVALDKGLPRTLNLKQILGSWIDHRIEVVRRRTRYELAKAEARAHLLEGYLKALDHLDEVVRLIRKSPNRAEAKEVLLARFDFTDRQATAVLELRLYQLTGLEREKIIAEHRELLEKIAHYKAILGSEALVRGVIREELEAVAKAHPSARRTQIIAAEGEFQMEDLVADEPVIITISGDDYIRRLPVDSFREQRRGGQGITGMELRREGDECKSFYAASTHDTLLIFTTKGRCYWLRVWEIPETGRRSKGKPLINLLEDIQPDEGIATTMRVRDFTKGGYLLLVTRQGVIKKTELSAFSHPRRKGIWALSIDEGDALIAAHVVDDGEHVMLFTRQGMAIRFDQERVRPMGRTARGVRGVKLKDEQDWVVGCEVVHGDESILIVCERGFGKRSAVSEFRETNRGGIGVRSIITNDRNGHVIGALSVGDEDGIVMMTASGQTIRISVGDLRVMGRNTQGVKMAQLKGEDLLKGVQKIPAAAAASSGDVSDD